MGSLGFERQLGAEIVFLRLYRCFDGAEVNAVDWREVVCAFRALNNTEHANSNPLKLLTIFFDVYSIPSSNTAAVARDSIITFVSLAAISNADIAIFRSLIPALPQFVSLSKLRNVLLHDHRRVLAAFQSQLWAQLPDNTKLIYLHANEDTSSRWFEWHIHQHNIKNAIMLQRRRILFRIYCRWREFCHSRRLIKNHCRTSLSRKFRNSISWWNLYATNQRMTYECRQVAHILGCRALVRRAMLCWLRWSLNQRRIRQAFTLFQPQTVYVAHGCFLTRYIITRASRRNAMAKWRQWVTFTLRWQQAGDFRREQIMLLSFRRWCLQLTLVKLARSSETDSVAKQLSLASLMDRADEENVALAKALALERVDEMRKKKQQATWEKLHALTWAKFRSDAERAAGDRIKLAIQEDSRAKRIAMEKEDRAASFQAAWEAIESRYIQKQRLATSFWLEADSSKSHVWKEFKRIKRDFYSPPSPRSMDREAKLKSLSSIVLIKMEAILFQKGVVMDHLIRQYDDDSSGFLSHAEFKKLITDLPISLSPEQIRLVIESLDTDQDGYVGLSELERALEAVHQHNGVSGSPWRMYIDPAQDVMCYHNLVADELIYEHRMTDKKLLEITKSNFIAEAELEATKNIRQQRALVIKPDRDLPQVLNTPLHRPGGACRRTMLVGCWHGCTVDSNPEAN